MVAIDWTKPLEFSDGTPITNAEPWHAFDTTGWIVRTEMLPNPWNERCYDPTRDPGTVILLDGRVEGFPDLPQVRNRGIPYP